MEPVTTTIIASATASILADFLREDVPKIIKSAGINNALTKRKIERYVTNLFDTNTKVRLLSNNIKDVYLKDVYVPSRLKDVNNNKIVTEENFFKSIFEGRRVTVRGTGGSGKTLMMKNLWLQTLVTGGKFVPLLVNLRRANSTSVQNKYDFEKLLAETLSSGDEIGLIEFKKLCVNSKLLLILDGFDEVNETTKNHIENEIIEFSIRYPDIPIVVTSRDNEAIRRLPHFHLHDVQGFNLEQTRSLVRKSQADHVVVENFLSVLTKGFYKEYETFLEIPLMSLMMLITFRSSSSIPKEKHRFYENVFRALYDDHDNSKNGWKRERHLGSLEIQRLLGVLSTQSYLKGDHEFTKSELEILISQSVKVLNNSNYQTTTITAKPNEIISDLSESLCLLVEDSGVLTFVHRTFQEYFAAYFIVFMEALKTEELLKAVAQKGSDQVLNLAYSMNPDLVIQRYVIPEFDRFNSLEVSRVSKQGLGLSSTSQIHCTCFLVRRGILKTLSGNTHKAEKQKLTDKNSEKEGIFEVTSITGEWNSFVSNINSLSLIKTKRPTHMIPRKISTDYQFHTTAITHATAGSIKDYLIDIKHDNIEFVFLQSGDCTIDISLSEVSIDDSEPAKSTIRKVSAAAEIAAEVHNAIWMPDFISDIENFKEREGKYRTSVCKELENLKSKSSRLASSSIGDLFKIA